MPRDQDNNDIADMKTDIALLKNNNNVMERIVVRMDDMVDKVGTLIHELAIQESKLAQFNQHLKYTDDRVAEIKSEDNKAHDRFLTKLEQFRKENKEEIKHSGDEVLASLDRMNKDTIRAMETLTKTNEELKKRISTLENWRWYMAGIGAVLVLIITKFPWRELLSKL